MCDKNKKKIFWNKVQPHGNVCDSGSLRKHVINLDLSSYLEEVWVCIFLCVKLLANKNFLFNNHILIDWWGGGIINFYACTLTSLYLFSLYKVWLFVSKSFNIKSIFISSGKFCKKNVKLKRGIFDGKFVIMKDASSVPCVIFIANDTKQSRMISKKWPK